MANIRIQKGALTGHYNDKNKKARDLNFKLKSIFFLAVTNVGSLNIYSMMETKVDGWYLAKEKDKAVASFIKTSAVVTTVHHILVLICIQAMGSADSSLFKHWESPEFRLKPSGHWFCSVVSLNMLLGTLSLVSLLLKRGIVAINTTTD